jgi:hypothetical protein
LDNVLYYENDGKYGFIYFLEVVLVLNSIVNDYVLFVYVFLSILFGFVCKFNNMFYSQVID